MSTNNKFTQWNAATASLTEQLVCALEVISKYGYQVIIKKLDNSLHTNPMKITAKSLDDPFAWKMISSFNQTAEQKKDSIERAHNDTERDLIANWTWVFGEPEAIELYREKRICSKGLFKGIGVCSQVRIVDMVKYLREIGDTELADLWESPDQYFNSGLWTPVNNQYWDDAEGMTYAVYFAENVESLSSVQLNEILDNSVIALLKS